jgi:hypothetical protein
MSKTGFLLLVLLLNLTCFVSAYDAGNVSGIRSIASAVSNLPNEDNNTELAGTAAPPHKLQDDKQNLNIIGKIFNNHPEASKRLTEGLFKHLSTSSGGKNFITQESFQKVLSESAFVPEYLNNNDFVSQLDRDGDGKVDAAELEGAVNTIKYAPTDAIKRAAEKAKDDGVLQQAFQNLRQDASNNKCDDGSSALKDSTLVPAFNVMKGSNANVTVCGNTISFRGVQGEKNLSKLQVMPETSKELQKRGFGDFVLNLFLTLLQVAAIAGLIILVVAIFIAYGAMIGFVTIGAALLIAAIIMLFVGTIHTTGSMFKSLGN